LKTKEFTIVNDCFQNEHNEKIGHYRQTLISGYAKLIGYILPILSK